MDKLLQDLSQLLHTTQGNLGLSRNVVHLIKDKGASDEELFLYANYLDEMIEGVKQDLDTLYSLVKKSKALEVIEGLTL